LQSRGCGKSVLRQLRHDYSSSGEAETGADRRFMICIVEAAPQKGLRSDRAYLSERA
jgi:hypothetical protein